MTRSKNNGPAPDPDRIAWAGFRKGKVRLYPDLCGGGYLDGRLLWVSSYTIGLEVPGGAQIIVNKAYIARTELREPAQQVRDGGSERDTNGVTSL